MTRQRRTVKRRGKEGVKMRRGKNLGRKKDKTGKGKIRKILRDLLPVYPSTQDGTTSMRRGVKKRRRREGGRERGG